jgi:2-octaprenyl-6-methoxyphenol hydroxylase
VGFRDLLSRDSEARVTLTDSARVSARLVIAADGRASPVRQAARIGVTTTRYGQKAVVFAVTHIGPHENISTEVHQSGGPFTLVPLPTDAGTHRSAVVWMIDGAEAQRLMTLPEAEFSAAATARSGGVNGPLTLASRRQVWPIISQRADRMIAERVALIAEAAHVMPPIGAQGLNMSLADIAALADLAETNPGDLGSRAMLQDYARKRERDVQIRVAGIDLLNRTSQIGNPALQDLRAAGIRALHDVTPVRKALMRLGLGAGRRD